MSVKYSLLALLSQAPMYGYQLRQEFESRTGRTWPLNVGQVYTTLSRLERDGLVVQRDRHVDGSVVYAITESGQTELHRWWSTAVGHESPSRDEVAIKLALAVTLPGVDVAAVIQRQRAQSMQNLLEYTRLMSLSTTAATTEQPSADPALAAELPWTLILDRLVFAAEAEIRWLDHVEQRLALAAAGRAEWSAVPEPAAGPEPASEPEWAAPATGGSARPEVAS